MASVPQISFGAWGRKAKCDDLRFLPPTAPMLKGMSDAKKGTLDIRQVGIPAKTPRPIDSSTRVALALTEACIRVGKGKIFWFPKPLRDGHGTHALVPFDTIPDLVYTPFVWSQEEKQAWLNMPHVARAELLNILSGTMEHIHMVMPLTMYFNSGDMEQIRVAPAVDLKFVGENISILVTPRLYVGWTEDFIKVPSCEIAVQHRAQYKYWVVMSQRDLREFQFHDVGEGMRRLNAMWYEAKQGSKCQFLDLLNKYIPLHREWMQIAAARRDGEEDGEDDGEDDGNDNGKAKDKGKGQDKEKNKRRSPLKLDFSFGGSQG